MTDGDIAAISQLVRDLCGLTLDGTKGYLIESRLGDIAKANGCASFAELAYLARSPAGRSIQSAIIDAITTQETLFFRDQSPFDTLQFKVIPDLIDAHAGTLSARRLRILSAACSTGQEAYSLGITVSETIPNVNTWDVNIMGIDISNAAVRQASAGRFANYEIQRGMKPHLLAKYFHSEGNHWKAKDELRGLMTFTRRNLLQPLTDLGPFDIIFCRNVAIYFDAPTRQDLFLRLANALTPGGYLFVGSSECLVDLGPRFAPQHHCRGTFYQPTGARPSIPTTPVAPTPTWLTMPSPVLAR